MIFQSLGNLQNMKIWSNKCTIFIKMRLSPLVRMLYRLLPGYSNSIIWLSDSLWSKKGSWISIQMFWEILMILTSSMLLNHYPMCFSHLRNRMNEFSNLWRWIWRQEDYSILSKFSSMEILRSFILRHLCFWNIFLNNFYKF